MAGISRASLLVGVLLGFVAEKGCAACSGTESTNTVMDSCMLPTERLSVPNKAVLLLGNTGVGKTTLARFLSEQDQNLTAVEVSTGAFIIEGEKIASSVCSMTTIPELMTNPASGTNYYDFPGFEDTRGACTEMATTFYMKDILEHVKEVKILLLTPYHAVLKGQDRREFMTMLIHAARLVRSPEKYGDSIALVVTKAEGYVKMPGDKSKLVPTPIDIIQKNVAKFLQEDVKVHLETQLLTREKNELELLSNKRALALVNTLLKSITSENDKIGVFRKPDESGTLDKIELMLHGKKHLHHMIDGSLKFSSVDPNDFGFSISDKTKLQITMEFNRLNDILFEYLRRYRSKLESHIWSNSYVSDNMTATVERLRNETETLQSFAHTLATETNLSGFRFTLEQFLKKYPFPDEVQDVVKIIDSFGVLRSVSDKEIIDGKTLARWASAFEAAAKVIEGEANWHEFLVRLYSRFSEYDVQFNKESYSVANLTLWGESQGISVTENGLQPFLAKVAGLGLTVPSHGGRRWVHDLEDLLSLTVRAEPNHTCSGDTLRVSGEYILMSNVLKIECAQVPRIIEVFALNTVFIDTNIRLVETALFIAAPTWSLNGQRFVNLDGLDAGSPSRRAQDGADGQRGFDGVPGLPGGPGAIFVGFGERFPAASHLIVSVRGGRGGSGQSGGYGGVGPLGGGNGGDGGDGGVGGLGGVPGMVNIFNMTPAHPAFRITTVITPGENGVGGQGGLGGEMRPHTARSRRRRDGGLLFLLLLGALSARHTPPQYYNGKAGRESFVRDGLQQPAHLNVSLDSVPEQYAAYLSLHLRHPYRSSQRTAFLEFIKSFTDPTA